MSAHLDTLMASSPDSAGRRRFLQSLSAAGGLVLIVGHGVGAVAARRGGA